MAASANDVRIMNVGIQPLMALMRDPTFAHVLNIEMKSENFTNNGVWYRFHHGVTFTSWGERITITLIAEGPYTTRIDLHSVCGMPTQIIDWGKNKRNIKAIFEYIEKNIGAYCGVMPAAPAQPMPQEPPQLQADMQAQPPQQGYPQGYAQPQGYPQGYAQPQGYSQGYAQPQGYPQGYAQPVAQPIEAVTVAEPQQYAESAETVAEPVAESAADTAAEVGKDNDVAPGGEE